MESEFYAMAPKGVSSHTTRIALGSVTAEELARTGERAVKAARLLASAPLDAMVFGCTSGSFIQGAAYDQEITRELQKASNGIPAITTATACTKALQALGAQKITIATPYTDDINARAREYFIERGFDVLGIKGLGITTDFEMTHLPPDRVYRLAKESWQPEADALLIGCTSLRTIEVLHTLESDIGKPVVSANQASLWSALGLAGVNESIPGFGVLLTL